MNLAVVHQELVSYVNKLHTRQDVLNRLREVSASLQDLEKQHKVLDSKSQKEERDYLKLKGKSISGVLKHLWGDREKALLKEEQEYVEAVMLYNQCLQEIELAMYEQSILNNKLKVLEGVEEKVHVLYEKAEYALLQSDSTSRRDLINVRKSIEENISIKNSVTRAIDTGESISKSARSMLYHVKKAMHSYHMSQQGSRKARNLMYGHIDKAESWLTPIFRYIQMYESMLSSLYSDTSPRLEKGFLNPKYFSSAFFRNFISDWIMQNNLKTVTHLISRELMGQLQDIQSHLKGEKQRLKKQYDDLQHEKKQIILNAKL